MLALLRGRCGVAAGVAIICYYVAACICVYDTYMCIYIYIKDEKGERRFEVCLQRFAELVVCEDLRPTGGGITCDSINEAGWRCCAD